MQIRTLRTRGLALGITLIVNSCSDKPSGQAEGGGVGAKCTRDAQCTGYKNATCVTEIQPLVDLVTSTDPKYQPFRDFTLPFPGGYCTSTLQNSCASNADCGAEGGCYLAFEGVPQSTIDGLAALDLPFDVAKFAHVGVCLRPCTGDSACRASEGYRCLTPLKQFLDQINPDYKKTFCVQDIDVSYLLQSPPGDGGTG